MTVIAYRDSDGNFKNAHETNLDEESVEKAIEKFNLEHPDNQADYFLLDEGSFEHYLWERSKRRIQFDREMLQDLHNAASEVESMAYELLTMQEEQQGR